LTTSGGAQDLRISVPSSSSSSSSSLSYHQYQQHQQQQQQQPDPGPGPCRAAERPCPPAPGPPPPPPPPPSCFSLGLIGVTLGAPPTSFGVLPARSAADGATAVSTGRSASSPPGGRASGGSARGESARRRVSDKTALPAAATGHSPFTSILFIRYDTIRYEQGVCLKNKWGDA